MHLRFDASPAQLPSRTAHGVRFQFRAPAGTRAVALAGTFNSWQGAVCMMRREAPELWACTVALTPGRHLYKFVVDGTEWIPDPANPWISEDGQNNSCLTVADDGAVLLRSRALGPEAPGPLYRRLRALDSPAWLRDAIVYQLSVRAFGGSLDGVRARLDHLSELGVNTVWLMPVHPIGLARRRGDTGDPYAVRDFAAIDPALGDAAGLRALVDALHARGMRVVYDWTLNRASIDNDLVRTHPDWFTRDAAGQVIYLVPQRAEFAGFDFGQPALRRYLLDAMRRWVTEFDLDGLRFDDSDITPTDFLDEIRHALAAVRPDIALISQAYDELHHVAACDLTYEGGTREVLRQIAQGEAGAAALADYWQQSTYSFPRGALRLRWLEDKEQPRANAVLGPRAHRPAATVLLALDGVPHLLMGQEFGEPTWRTWSVLFEGAYRLDWSAFDRALFAHYRALIALRRAQPALRGDAVAFCTGLAPGLVGFRRGPQGEQVLVVANLTSDPQPLAAPPQLLYADGWDAAAGALGPFGSLVARGP